MPRLLVLIANSPAKDNWNFDAHGRSFAWLAAQKGVDVTLVEVPHARHTLRYFKGQQRPVFEWLARQILPPALLSSSRLPRAAPNPGASCRSSVGRKPPGPGEDLAQPIGRSRSGRE